MREDVDLLLQFADSVVDRVDDVVLLGMGGSSLAPEVIKRTFRQETFHVLDTTHPQAIRDLEAQIDVSRTLFISASKSGSTLETRSHTDYFWERTGRNGDLFAAITDPGSELEQLAREREFAAIFAGEPTIGGRYSALSPFGMVPAALMGVDVARLARPGARDGRGLPARRGQPRARARALARRAVARGPRQDLHRAERRAASASGPSSCSPSRRASTARGSSRARRARGRARPAGAGGAPERRVRARPGVLPLGVRDRGRRVDPGDQPVRPARRAVGEGQDEREVLASGSEPDVAPAGSAEELFAQAQRGRLRLHPGVRQSDRRGRARSVLELADAGARRRRAASSRTASGRATCTRPGSCTRAGRRRASSCRSSTTRATSWRSPGSRSGSGS